MPVVSEKKVRSSAKVEPYDGQNARMNELMVNEDGSVDSVFIVQGQYGRRPIMADSEEAAVDRYVELCMAQIKYDQENELE